MYPNEKTFNEEVIFNERNRDDCRCDENRNDECQCDNEYFDERQYDEYQYDQSDFEKCDCENCRNEGCSFCECDQAFPPFPQPEPECHIGPMGPVGPRGSKGPQGPRGLQGPQGREGVQGIRGPQGNTGLQGPIGMQGLVGPTGPHGMQGPQGTQGVTGARGSIGPQGVQGPQGNTGPAGDTTPPIQLASASLYSFTDKQVCPNEQVVFDMSNIQRGFTIADDYRSLCAMQQGTYVVEFGLRIDNLVRNGDAIGLCINGTSIIEESRMPILCECSFVSGVVIVCLSAGEMISLVVDGNNAVVVCSGNNTVNAYLVIHQIN